jgi:hypothetical protein
VGGGWCRATAAQRGNGGGLGSPVAPPPQLQFKVAALLCLAVSREPTRWGRPAPSQVREITKNKQKTKHDMVALVREVVCG